jgi:hypothetical protein
MLALHRGDAPGCSSCPESFAYAPRWKISWVLCSDQYRRAALLQGDISQASQRFNEALELIQAMQRHGAPTHSIQEGMAWLLQGVARLASAQDQPLRALRLAGTSTALLEAINETFPPTARAYSARSLKAARSRLSKAAAEAAWEEGASLSLQGDDWFEAVTNYSMI